MKLTLLCALILGAAGFMPVYADSELSDVLTVYDPTGAIAGQLKLFEDGSTSCIGTLTCGDTANHGLGTEDPAGVYYINVGVDANQFGRPINLIESGSVFSDIFGVANISGTLALGFTSDTEDTPPLFAPVGDINAQEGLGPIVGTQFLDPELQRLGWTATFESDPIVPEPSSVVLMSTALLGALFVMRKRMARA